MNAPTALAYDAVHILAEAIRTATSTKPEALLASLNSIKDYHGVTGTITFDANGDATKGACIVEIRNGKPFFLKTFSR
jgi:branched-chain amino acid transport system substrate-binding protein